jgi:transmembrane sensor
MTEEEAKQLLIKFAEGLCTPEEEALIQSWYNNTAGSLPSFSVTADYEKYKRQTLRQIKRRRIPVSIYLRYAAAVVVIAGMAYFILRTPDSEEVQIAADIQPGSNQAILTLGNGQKISLKDAKNVVLPGIRVSNDTALGTVTYNSSAETDPALINTITTPGGGQYQLVLPDGTKVFLNATSSLTFPSRFALNKREVNLTGEAYFEVTKDSKKPFLVTSKGQQLKVLGTHFNISAYPDEPLRTTLAEGKVEISLTANPQKTILTPGDQSIVSLNEIHVAQVNPDDVIAWKDGLFAFNQLPLKDVFQQLGRWYNVSFELNSKINSHTFDGEIPRTYTLSQVLSLIELSTNLKFKVDGRKVSIQ